MPRYNATPDNCFHLTVDTVREIHTEAITRFGGARGVRDENLLASAVLAPQASFGGKSPYTDIVEVAAAYLFYLCKNHPFLDGNKRTAMMSAILFLRINGIEPLPDSPRWKNSCSMSRPVRSSALQPPSASGNCSSARPSVADFCFLIFGTA
jgi:death-on-curing protein